MSKFVKAGLIVATAALNSTVLAHVHTVDPGVLSDVHNRHSIANHVNDIALADTGVPLHASDAVLSHVVLSHVVDVVGAVDHGAVVSVPPRGARGFRTREFAHVKTVPVTIHV